VTYSGQVVDNERVQRLEEATLLIPLPVGAADHWIGY